jgi:hypothetical protein
MSSRKFKEDVSLRMEISKSHLGHTVLFGELYPAKLLRVSIDERGDLSHWIENRPFPHKRYLNQIQDCLTCATMGEI